ncbi:MAG: right-handed parallel beta-helix repeat-containing protein [Saprospiraceae bacterium]|nr:right-handed parallel beta-helix repeat-containing protein [Saprospiraceae bacterium]MDW8228455.1 right-handed parallel beta-helix repeat-containing protein [Saprospiraceae bacterium]
MKQRLLTLLLFAFCTSLWGQKVIYVRSNATGANDGTSWQNAFTNLAAALTAAQPGDQVWTAAGRYRPTAADTPLTVKAGVALYGGFAGTETTLGARNPTANVTILSGDIAGNDIPGTFNQNRTDNAVHVVEVIPTANPDARAIVDGFTISGGQTLVGASAPDLSRRGGGLLANAKVTVRNCRFVDNNGDTGGALAAVLPGASGILVEDCIFEKNNTSLLSSGIYFRDLAGGSTVRRCIFRENKTIRGVLYAITSANMVVDSCQFLNNDAGNTPCAALYTWQTTFTLRNSLFRGNRSNDFTGMYNDGRNGIFPFLIENCIFEENVAVDSVNTGNLATGGAIFNATATCTIRNCVFRNNRAHLGGAIYLSDKTPGQKTVIENCTFDDNRVFPAANTTAARGGAFYSLKGNYEMRNCTFRRNSATTSGGHIHNADSTLSLVKICRFEGANATFGAAVGNYAAGTVAVFDSCVFSGNTAATSGGAISTAFTASTTVQNCNIESNAARFGAGLFVQNSRSRLTIRNTAIVSNNAQANGGGVNISAGVPLTIENCEFLLNAADIGGAINIADDTSNLALLVARNTVFQNNFANSQAAGINLSNADAELYNCLFYANNNLSSNGAGGAICNNATNGSGGPLSQIRAVNCTFVENVAPIGGGIAQWQDTAGGTSILRLRNSILYGNTGKDYEVEDGKPTVISLGGNLCGDATLNAVLTQTNDQKGLDPLFVDPNFFNFRLKTGSPCIDKGVTGSDVPTTDLDGNPRDAKPDQGCYEFITSSIRDLAQLPKPLRLMPNPAREQTRFEVEDDWSGQGILRLTNASGAEVRSITVQKPAGLWTQTFHVGDLPAGAYRVSLLLGERRYEGYLVKK